MNRLKEDIESCVQKVNCPMRNTGPQEQITNKANKLDDDSSITIWRQPKKTEMLLDLDEKQ